MKFKILLVLFSAILFSFQSGKVEQVRRVSNNHFVPYAYREVPLGRIHPKGWLQHQLQIMLKGSTGHLDEVYAKLKNDNGWLGGKGDGWEETPYWLDGALPLAFLLDDNELKTKITRYVNWVIENQRPSGYFGPVTKWERETGKKIDVENSAKGEDWWPKMIMLKVLQQYYSATNDSRVIKFMAAYFHYQMKVLNKSPLGSWSEWATARGADNILVAQWLYSITKDNSLPALCKLIKAQAFPWSNWFTGRDWVINAATQQNDENWMRRHGVNVAMGLKDPMINYQATGDKKYLASLSTGFNDLMTLHGLPNGIFTADEDLHGNEPTQGTELCAIVETMFSMEQAIAISGDVKYMDALERMTFNALPAQTTDDYNEKQYFQIPNQVQISKGVFHFSLPFEREMNNVLGMRSGYTCCLADMHQGWTKFSSHLWYATADNGLAALEYSPNEITTNVGKNNSTVTIVENTSYPFGDLIDFEIKSKTATAFPLVLRIPAWCKRSEITINGTLYKNEAGGRTISINRTWKNGDVIRLQLPMEVSTSNWGRNSRAVERGPLVYALKLEEDWKQDTEPKEGAYYSVYTKTDWNYGVLSSFIKEPAKESEVNKTSEAAGDFVWNLQHAPFEIKIKGKKIPEWKIVEGVAPQPVTDRTGVYRGKVDETVHTLTLVPYGCTKVRIVAFPVVE